jgi:hypothetical protein
VRSLAQLGLNADTLAALRQAARHPHARIRRRAAPAVGRLDPDAVALLTDLLSDSHCLVRAASARALIPFAAAALPAVPRLLRCRHDGHPHVSALAGLALSGMIRSLPAPLSAWLVCLTPPFEDAATALARAVANPTLPVSVREEFAALCQRRDRWRERVRGLLSGILPGCDPDVTEAAWRLAWLWDQLCRVPDLQVPDATG